ncbi:Alpha-mannosyltransferase [Phaffia rhodozyma]|uniref:Alpha-mannosyltransferase n=1 Tax=Phaffia rhodozyma TaxID=264483 RepID=A0A0F7SIA6_PHARH|nr:Alpha-mannosyltransferase [Phaffia rhodozyma]
MIQAGLPAPYSSASSTTKPPSVLASLDTLTQSIPRRGIGNVLKRYLGLIILALTAALLALGWHNDIHSSFLSSLEEPAPEVPSSVFKRPHPIYHNRTERPIDISSQPLPLHTSTKDRLVAWAQSPGGSGEVEGELEQGGFYHINMESCANVWPSHSSDLMKNSIGLWMGLNRSTIHEHRMRLINRLYDLDQKGATQNYGSGRGIVLSAGNADTLERVLYILRMLRHVYHSKLPVQIYHFPSEKPPADSKLVQEARELGAELVEAKGSVKDEKRRKNYHLKALAIVQCPWREVLYLDSDNVPTRDPEYMFDSPPYKRLRAIFWPDFWKTAAANPVWSILGVRCRDEWEMEAGQIFIDKKYHLDAMLLSQHMLEDFKFWFNFSDGDKDIFRFAFLALRKRWGVPGRNLGVGGLPRGTQSGDFCGLTMMQYDHLGDPLFVHYNLLKQVPSGIRRGFSWGRTKQFPLFIAPKGQSESNKAEVIDATLALAQDGDDLDYEDAFDKVRGFGDVDCDMLADADDLGHARAPAAEAVRRRAATERGGRAFFHGGYVSALCIDARYDDPRPDETREEIKLLKEAEDIRLQEMWTAKGLKEGDEGWGVPENTAGDSPLGIVWDENQYEVAQWSDDPLLKDFENTIYDQGFVPSAKGF